MAKVLTSKFVENVKPPALGRSEYWDAALPGFVLRVTEKCVKSFSFRYRAATAKGAVTAGHRSASQHRHAGEEGHRPGSGGGCHGGYWLQVPHQAPARSGNPRILRADGATLQI